MKKVVYTLTKAAKPIGEHSMIEPIPDQSWEQFDPFLLLHHHGPHTFLPFTQGLPFGPHPHRGFETLTVILKGSIEHKDSSGSSNTVYEGGVQWMTAARGIVHSENISPQMRENGGEMEIIQLWMNLPAALKMRPANYIGLQKEAIPVVCNTTKNFATQLISGVHSGIKGAVDSQTNLTIFMVETTHEKGKETYNLSQGDTTLIYLISGQVTLNKKSYKGPILLQLSEEERELGISSDKASRFLIISGPKLNEKIVAQGPFVMNNTTEILQAMRDYQMGKMGVL